MPDDVPPTSPDSSADGGADEVAAESAEVPTQGPTETGHDPSGLETARALAASMRGGLSRKRGAARSSTKGRARSSQLSGAHPDDRDPGLVGAAVERLVAESGWSTDVAVHGVFGRWSSIVGSEVAEHCTPESFKDGHLSVRTDSTAWATQLRLLAPTVVRRLNEELGHGTVLRIDVAGPQAPSWRRGARSVRDGRGPRDTYG